MIIENFTLSEYMNQPKEVIENYLTFLKYVHPKKTKQKVFHMKLKHVELIKKGWYIWYSILF